MERNRLRRRLRSAVSTIESEAGLSPGAYLVVPSRETSMLEYEELVSTVHTAIGGCIGEMPARLGAESDRSAHTVPRLGSETGCRPTQVTARNQGATPCPRLRELRSDWSSSIRPPAGTRPSPCRYVPSCSEYAVESFERHGLLKGGALAVRRIGRCRPFGGYGADPVPD